MSFKFLLKNQTIFLELILNEILTEKLLVSDWDFDLDLDKRKKKDRKDDDSIPTRHVPAHMSTCRCLKFCMLDPLCTKRR